MTITANRPHIEGVSDDALIIDDQDLRAVLSIAQYCLHDDDAFESSLASRLSVVQVEPAIVHLGARVARELFRHRVDAPIVEALVVLFCLKMALRAGFAHAINEPAFISWRPARDPSLGFELVMSVGERPHGPCVDLRPLFSALGVRDRAELAGRGMELIAMLGDEDGIA